MAMTEVALAAAMVREERISFICIYFNLTYKLDHLQSALIPAADSGINSCSVVEVSDGSNGGDKQLTEGMAKIVVTKGWLCR